jgi:predicted RNase H-like nuclease (RuvC/YqgF family)
MENAGCDSCGIHDRVEGSKFCDGCKEEEALQNRDDTVEAKLRKAVRDIAEEIQETEYRLSELRSEKAEILREVKAENWYNLSGYLTEQEVESLCECSPQDLLAD